MAEVFIKTDGKDEFVHLGTASSLQIAPITDPLDHDIVLDDVLDADVLNIEVFNG